MVRTGYQQTEVGEIPEDWEVRCISDLGSGSKPPIKAGPFGSSLTKDTYVKSGFKVYGQEQVIRGDHLYGDYYIDHSKYRLLESCSVSPGDVLLSLVGTAGKLLIVPAEAEPGVINPRLIRFSLDRERVSSDFFKGVFESDLIQSYLSKSAQGGTMSVLNAKMLRDVTIPLPSLEEQTVITRALSDVDELIASLEKLIAKKRDIKTATMQQLLTGKKRLPGFGEGKGTKQTELGEIPEDWDVRTYGNTFSFLSTANNSRSDLSEEGDIAYIHYGDIHTKIHFWLDLAKQNLPKIDRSKFKNPTFLEDGDVVMADASEDYDGIGKSIEVSNVGKKRVIAGLHTFLLRDTEKRYADGFRAYLHAIPAVKQAFDTLATGLKVYGLSKASLRDVSIPVPPFKEQEEIVKVLTGMSADLELAEKRLSKTKAIKQGMMQELLTGRTRLV